MYRTLESRREPTDATGGVDQEAASAAGEEYARQYSLQFQNEYQSVEDSIAEAKRALDPEWLAQNGGDEYAKAWANGHWGVVGAGQDGTDPNNDDPNGGGLPQENQNQDDQGQPQGQTQGTPQASDPSKPAYASMWNKEAGMFTTKYKAGDKVLWHAQGGGSQQPVTITQVNDFGYIIDAGDGRETIVTENELSKLGKQAEADPDIISIVPLGGGEYDIVNAGQSLGTLYWGYPGEGMNMRVDWKAFADGHSFPMAGSMPYVVNALQEYLDDRYEEGSLDQTFLVEGSKKADYMSGNVETMPGVMQTWRIYCGDIDTGYTVVDETAEDAIAAWEGSAARDGFWGLNNGPVTAVPEWEANANNWAGRRRRQPTPDGLLMSMPYSYTRAPECFVQRPVHRA